MQQNTMQNRTGINIDDKNVDEVEEFLYLSSQIATHESSLKTSNNE